MPLPSRNVYKIYDWFIAVLRSKRERLILSGCQVYNRMHYLKLFKYNSCLLITEQGLLIYKYNIN